MAFTYRPYADLDYYKNEFKGSLVGDDEIEKMLKESSRSVDTLTFNRIVKQGFENLTPFQQEIIQESVCMQVDFMAQYGTFLETPISGYSAGSTSVQFDSSKLFQGGGVVTSTKIASYLEQTGLMVRLFI